MKQNALERLLAERRTGLGATDTTAILGLSPFKTAFEVQQEKLNGIISEREVEHLQWGILLEPVIAAQYMKETGEKVRRMNSAARHPKYPFILAHLDYWCADYVLECKNISFGADKFGDEGSDEIPDEYNVQVQKQMLLANKKKGKLRALFFGNKAKTFNLDRNERIVDRIIEADQEFWTKHIEGKEPVTPDFDHPTTLPLLKRIYSLHETTVDLNEEMSGVAMQYKALGTEIYEREKQRKALQGRILYAMGDASYGLTTNGYVMKRREIKRTGYTVEDYSYVELRVLQPKEKKESA